MDEWQLGNLTAGALQDLGLDEAAAWQAVAIIKLVTGRGSLCAASGPYPALSSLLQDGDVQRFLGVNRYQGVLWFNREAFRTLVWWLYAVAVIDLLGKGGRLSQALEPANGEATEGLVAGEGEPGETIGAIAADLAACYAQVERLLEAERTSGYQVEALLEAVKG
jgi:hypothetical protein